MFMCRKRLSSPRCRSELIDSAWVVIVPGQKCIKKSFNFYVGIKFSPYLTALKSGFCVISTGESILKTNDSAGWRCPIIIRPFGVISNAIVLTNEIWKTPYKFGLTRTRDA